MTPLAVIKIIGAIRHGNTLLKIMRKLNSIQKRKLMHCFWKALDTLIRLYNPCRIKDGACRRGKSCCTDCDYLSPYGCATRCLTCKLWFCDEVLMDIHKYPKLFMAVSRINGAVWLYDLPLEHRKPIGSIHVL